MDLKTTMGPLGVKSHVNIMRKQVNHATQHDGATIIRGSVDFTMGGELSEGNWVEPIVLEGTKFDSQTFHEEFFCPVFNLYKVETD